MLFLVALFYLVTKVLIHTFPVCNQTVLTTAYPRGRRGSKCAPTKEIPLFPCWWFSEIESPVQGLCHKAYILIDWNIAYLGSCEEVGVYLPWLISGDFLLPAPSGGDKRRISDIVKESLNSPASHSSPEVSTSIPFGCVNLCMWICVHMSISVSVHTHLPLIHSRSHTFTELTTHVLCTVVLLLKVKSWSHYIWIR